MPPPSQACSEAKRGHGKPTATSKEAPREARMGEAWDKPELLRALNSKGNHSVRPSCEDGSSSISTTWHPETSGKMTITVDQLLITEALYKPARRTARSCSRNRGNQRPRSW